MKYVLELWPGRRLTEIGHGVIRFNVSGYLTFDTEEAAKDFLAGCKAHFFFEDGSTLLIVEEEK